MKIVIDCRYSLSGIGRYLVGILEELEKTNFSSHDFYLLGPKDRIDKYENTKKIYSDLSPFSPKSLFKEKVKEINKCDVFFTPNFIIPYGIKIKTYCTIHDVIFMEQKDSSNGFIDYSIKKHLLKRACKKATKIFTVSEFSKSRINHYFKCLNKIVVGYIGLSKSILNSDPTPLEKEDYLVFVGNVKKNKGLATLVEAINNIDIKLYIVGSKDNFRTKDTNINKYLDNKNIIFTGKISDDDLITLIKKAKFLIQPSTYEGFGLPPMESLYLNTKPIISDIDVFKEVYKDYDVIYFKSEDSKDLQDKILTSSTSIKPYTNPKYSFEYTTNTILNVIEGDAVEK